MNAIRNDEAARELATSRVLPFAPAQVFRAIAEPERLARWWGPAGFTNSFERFEFRPGGAWNFVMHGPDGKDYRNESVFEAIEPGSMVVVRHSSAPHFTLTVSLAAEGGGTRVRWRQLFDDAKVREQLEAMCVPANEQNLDRLQAELAAHAQG
jgi:uncharacterized protein YndB with AHSA1/START domain